MSSNILMPALSPTMEEGKLAKWHVREGEATKPEDIPSTMQAIREALAPASPPAEKAQPPAPAAPPTAPRSGNGAAAPPTEQRIFASPLAKKIAQLAGLDIAVVHGSGP